MSAKGMTADPAGSVLIQTCIWLLVLLDPLARCPVVGQSLKSPCPKVFSNQFDPGTKQWVGHIQLHNISVGQLVKLNVDLSIGIPIPEQDIGSITLVKSSEQTLRDIESNLPAQYRIDFRLNNVIPSLLEIKVNDETICTGKQTAGKKVNSINLQHAFFARMVPLLINDKNGNNVNNVSVILAQPSQTQGTRIRLEVLPTLVVPTSSPVSLQPTIKAQPPTTESTPAQTLPTVQPARSSVNYGSAKEDIMCGKPTQVFNLLSINGTRSPKGQFPWASPIFDISSSTPSYICGSTIITTTHLVTAAHCMYDTNGAERTPNHLLTMPGMYNIDNFFDVDLQERKVVKIVIHDDYYFEETGLADSDIAVMKVDQPIVFNHLVQPICLWTESNNLQEIVGVKGFVSGWGVTENGEAKYPSYVTATVVDKRACANSLDKVIPSSSRLFCGNGHGSVPCNGDSGSGFVIKRGSKYFLRGVVSVGQYDRETLTCAVDKYILYTDVAPLRYWLRKVTTAS